MRLITRAMVVLCGLASLVGESGKAATHPDDPLQQLTASLARTGRIDDPVGVAMILQNALGVGLVRENDFFGRSDVIAGQTRYGLDDRDPLARQGLEVALLIRHPDFKTGHSRAEQNAALGEIRAELDINDWGIISRRPWRSVADSLGKLYSSVVLPDTPGLPSFDLPADPCCRLVLTVAPRRSELLPVWFVHITEYQIRSKS